jgi:ligand-binding sensor domain-containing protein
VKRAALILVLSFLLPAVLSAKWEIFTNKNTVRDVLVDAGRNKTHLATNGGLVELSAIPDPLFACMTTLDGLSSNDLACLARDASGNLLAGTASEGMAILFSGGDVKNYSTFDGLPDDRVLCIVPAGSEFWVGTAQGAVKMELSGAFVNRKSPIYFGEPLNYEVRDLWPGDSEVWFATSNGLWVLDGDELRSYGTGEGLADNSVRDIIPAEGDSLYIATDSGVQVFQPAGESFHDFSNGLVTEGSRNVRELARIGDQLWAATESGAYRTGLGAANWVDETLDLPTRDILSIAQGLSGLPVAGTTGKGIATRGEGGWDVQNFPGPLVNSLDRVAVDQDGVVWASSWSVSSSLPGIFRYDGLAYQNYTSGNSDLLYNLASALAVAPDGRLWIGSPYYSSGGSGLSILDDGATAQLDDDVWTTLKGTETGLSGDAIRNSIAFKGSGEAWIGSWEQNEYGLPGGLDVVSYAGGEYIFRSFPDLAQGRELQALAVDGNGDLWIGYTTTSVDVFILRPVTADGDSLFFPIDPDGLYLAGTNVLDIEVDPLGHLWVCTSSGVTELAYNMDPLDPANFTWKNYTMDTSPLPDLQVNAVAFQGTRYSWFATPSGAASYDRERGLWVTYDTDTSPIPDDNVTDVAVDARSGAVWLATRGGLAKFSMIEDEPPVAESGSIIVAPNPFLPARNPQGVLLGRFEPGTTVRVFSIAGSLVTELTARGETISWDGKSREGEEVPSGVYLLVSKSPGGSIGRGKIAIVR